MSEKTPRSAPSQAAIDSFAVPGWMHRVSGFIERHRRGMIRLGNWETRTAAQAIQAIQIKAPVYVAGLARSGTTILLEQLAGHPHVATHQYRDYPPVFTPYWWNRYLEHVPQNEEQAEERAHGDGIAVTSRSPEAFEEALWMAFFPHLHDASGSSVLGRDDSHPAFERFYDEHLRKLLAVRGRRRYVAKGNYNLGRLAYLQRLYPDARFVLAVRDPAWHIASLMKQQTLFAAGMRAHPRSVDHLRRVGHFEFGLDRRPIHTGDDEAVARIQALWRDGQEVEGWARYWAMIYADLADRLATDERLREACLVVVFERLCQEPEQQLAALFAHCQLPLPADRLQAMAARIRFPGYYQPGFTQEEMALIESITAPVAARFGYRGVSPAGRGTLV
ncbi:MAG: sulfotransferase [Salinisphaera sp.]|nr:sulfotransferase [Salinisphaera sp.]